MPVDQGIADAKGKLGAVHRFKPDDKAAQEDARINLEAAKLYRDIRRALEAGIKPEHKKVAARILSGRA